MYGRYFSYNGETSLSYGLIIAGFEVSDEIPFAMNREILSGTLNRYRNRTNHMGTKWADVLTFQVSMIKDVCENPSQEQLAFTEDEVNAINAWLTSPDYPTLFHMYDFEDGSGNIVNYKYDYFGVFSDITPQVLNGEVFGFTMTFTTDSPFAWTQEITKTFECSDGDTISFAVNSAEKYREIYPVITITPPRVEGGTYTDIQIHNNTDGKDLTLNVLGADDTVIDCRHCKISNYSGLVSFEDLGITDVDYIYWPRLYNGQNSFDISGDCTITFKYREPRKVGAY